MENLSPFSDFSFGVAEDKHSSSNDIFWASEGLNEVNKVQFSGAEDRVYDESRGIFYSFSSSFGLIPNDPSEEQGYLLFSDHQQKGHQNHQQLSYLDYDETFDNLQFDMVPSQLRPIQTCLGGDGGGSDFHMFDESLQPMVPLCEPTKENHQYPTTTPLASLELLKSFGNNNKGFKRPYDEGKTMQKNVDLAQGEVCRKLSTEDIMRIAGTRFIQSSSSSSESRGLNTLIDHPFGFSFSGLSDEEKEDVELAESLLSCAEKVGYKQFDRAGKLLSHCESLSSMTGNPVKRVVHYFAEALRLRIDVKTGRVSSKELKKVLSYDPEEITRDLSPTLFAYYEVVPFSQVTTLTTVQAVIENVINAKKIHIVDLEIRKGGQWTVLMQALESRHECPIELLKITAVGRGTTSKHIIEDTGKRLKDFALSLNIPFRFNLVNVPDMLQLREDLFEIDPEETIAVYSNFALSSMIPQPDQLETIMRVIKTLRPSVMVVTELEANHNSASFVNRFIEALFYFSAFFDCLETCMKQDDLNRMSFESQYFAYGIKNIVAAEGAERKSRNVKIDVWRAFFSRFGMVETELSRVSLFQAKLVAERFPCGNYCTFDMNENSLLFGWKGTPINSISVWKFT